MGWKEVAQKANLAAAVLIIHSDEHDSNSHIEYGIINLPGFLYYLQCHHKISPLYRQGKEAMTLKT